MKLIFIGSVMLTYLMLKIWRSNNPNSLSKSTMENPKFIVFCAVSVQTEDFGALSLLPNAL